MAIIPVNQVNTIINEAYKQITGTAPVEAINLSTLVDIGNNPDICSSKEMATKALTVAIANTMYTDSMFDFKNSVSYYVNKEDFGAIMRTVSIEMPEVTSNPSWASIEDNKVTFGQYTFPLPIVNEQLYGKSATWALEYAIKNDMWANAFTSESNLMEFISFIYLAERNAIVIHRHSEDMANRNNFIAEKINYALKNNDKKAYINIREMYNTEHGTAYTMAQFLNNADCLRYSVSVIKNYLNYVKEETVNFNTVKKPRHINDDRLAIQMLSAYVNKVETVLYSDTRNLEFVKLDGYTEVPFWQSCGSYSFTDVSSINVNCVTDESNVVASGIIALIVDKYAIIHTIQSDRYVAHYEDIPNIQAISHQFKDRYVNNLTLSGIVFTISDTVEAGTNSAKVK